MGLKQSDRVIFFANIVIALSLLPSIFSEDKPHALTSLFNVGVTLIFICGYIGAKLKYAIIGNSIIGLMWLILLIQTL